ncbi:S6 family peptidase [Campylobacter upsaliensis]|uniref:S6 family peptidase n=1 Tax=Campylobacter upsaliensis TaxID=28080 RepID=UPI0022EAC887|nr:S6 family peptidase [Campylobacter upsaliensis]
MKTKRIKNKKIGVIIVLSTTLVGGLDAQIIHIDKFFYRDFLDLGQNKGAFTAGAKDVIIHSLKQPGVSVSFEAPIIDQSARSNNGNTTSLGRNFVITATHVAGSSGDSNDALVNSHNREVKRWGQTTYNISGDKKSKNYGYDVTFARFNKYIVEGETEIFDAKLESYSKDKEQKNLETLKKYLTDNATNNKGELIIFQAGSGILSLFNAPGNGFNRAGIAAISGTRGGSFSRPIDLERITYENSTANQNVNARGIQLIEFTDKTWVNGISPGDSGSGFYIYDKTKKKWLLLGVTSKADLVGQGSAGVAVATKADFETFKKQNEWEFDLKGGQNWTFEKQVGQQAEFKQNGSNSKQLQTDKDIVFQNGGTIDLKADMDLMVSGQVGGLVFKAKANNGTTETTYTITSNGTNNNMPFGFNGAGLDIEENVKVEWGLGFINGKKTADDALHKVGKGTLIFKTAPQNPSSDGKYGYLRVGDGKVIFNTDKQVLDGVHLTSGRGTLELTKDKAQAFGARKNTSSIDAKLPNHFILDQNKVTELGFYFGNGGGNFDLKGNSLTLNTISSNDAHANIINTDTTQNSPSAITIEGYGYDTSKNKTHEKANTIIHASFGQDTKNSTTTSPNTNNNLNLIYKGNGTAALIFDGNIDAKGLEVGNGKVVLQGHPTTHAYIRNENVTATQYGKPGQKNFLNLVKGAEGKSLPTWMDLSRPSTLDQPDWDHRVFKFERIDLSSGAKLDIGREATLDGHIEANSGSVINFGGDIEHYIDKKDGENTTGNGFDYRQEVEKKTLTDKNIANQTTHFHGSITADNTTITSGIYDFNAKLNLTNNANLTADYLTLDREKHNSGAILTMNNSTANVKNLIFRSLNGNHSGIINASGSGTLQVTQSLGFEKSSFDLSNLNSINGMNKPGQYDIFAKDKSNITGANTTITGNVGVMGGSTLNIQSINLESVNKNSIIVDGQGSTLNVSDKISTRNQDNVTILIRGVSNANHATLSATKGIELSGSATKGLNINCSGKVGVECFNNTQTSNIILASGGKLDANNLKATNLALNVSVDKNSDFLAKGKTLESSASSVALNFELGKEREFDIDAKSQSHITLNAYTANDTTKATNALYQGTLKADNSRIDVALSNITAKVDLSNGASLNIAQGGTLTLDNTHNSISLNGNNTTLKADTIIADKLNNLTLNVMGGAKFNVRDFVFKSGTLSNSAFYGENVHLQEGANLTLNGGGLINHNLYISGKSNFNTNSNDVLLSGGKTLVVGGESNFKVDNNDGTLSVNGGGNTKIQTELGSTLGIKKLLAQGGSSVSIELDLPQGYTKSTQKNFSIEANKGSNVYLTSWDMNRESFDSKKTTSLKTDDNSRIHFDTLTHDMTKTNNTQTPIAANLSISQHLHLENVGKQSSGSQPFKMMTIKNENALSPRNQIHSSSDSLSLAAQVGTSEDRFHALKVENSKNLTLENGTRIDVKLDSSIKTNHNDSLALNKYYTLISAGSITDKRTDKRVNFSFTSAMPLHWNTIVEEGQVKVKFLKEDPSSYKELSKHINNDKLLDVLIQHNPKDDFVQMAGTASQYEELEGHLGKIDKDMNDIAKNSVNIVEKVLLTNNQNINARVSQVRYTQKNFALAPVLLASNDVEAMSLAFEELETKRNKVWANTSAGAFTERRGDANLKFYSINVGYDKVFDRDNGELMLGVMAGLGRSNYDASIFNNQATLVNFGFYGLYQTGNHEFQTNLSISSINGDRSVQGVLGSENAKSNSYGLLSHNYYKYHYALKKGEKFESFIKPMGLLSVGYDGIGTYKGSNYAQKDFDAFNIGLGAGVEYALVGEKESYGFSLLARQNIYNSANQVFVSLSNAKSFIGYELNAEPLTFELDFIGRRELDKGFGLQYGFSIMSDVEGGYGGRGNINLEYKF